MDSKKLKKELEEKYGLELKETIQKIENITKNSNLIDTEKFDYKEIAKNINNIDIKSIISNPYQPRKYFEPESLNELAISIKSYGVLNPILLKRYSQGYYIVAGERRHRACQLLGIETMPAIILNINDNEMQEIALLENIQREDLTAIEEAIGYKKLLEKQNITHEELAKKIGKSRSYITNTISLLKLPEKIQNYVLSGKLQMGHVKQLHTLNDSAKMLELAERTIKNNLSARKVENIIKGYKLNAIPRKRRSLQTLEEFEEIQELIQTKLHAKVIINKKTIYIKFRDIKHLNIILKKLNLFESF